jgi:predicted Zn-dependent peptidase
VITDFFKARFNQTLFLYQKSNSMKKFKVIFYTLMFVFTFLTVKSQNTPYFNPDQIDIPYSRFVLDNGLTLIVHEDHKAPIVAVNIWYHVGSKNEKPGRTGFAHLFEHLMFNGSENFNNDYFKALQAIGATDLNGTTNNDRTNYFQCVPLAALDQVLFLESDRMGHLAGAIDQAKLDEQRGVVQNEKRQYENSPYGRQDEIGTKATYPPGHPYSWTVIGSMEDLTAASLDDVKEWFKTYYGPSNAVLSIAGDVKPNEILEKVKLYFGDIPAGPTLIKPELNIAKRQEETRGYYEDRVPEARISMTWNVPQWGTREATLLDLATSILSEGKTSRLYKKLVYEDQAASSAYAYINPREISGYVLIEANVKPDKSVEQVEETMNKILQEFLEKGPTQDELDRVRSNYFANFLKGIERIGGFGGKSDILATNEVYGGSPDYYKKVLKYVAEASVADIQKVSQEWLSSGKYVLVCSPFPTFKAAEKGVDRSNLPGLGTPVAASFPNLQKATLNNGLNVVLAQRKDVPTIVGYMLLNAGYANDGSKAGLASLAMDMLDEGTKNQSTLEISEKLQLLGASVSTQASLDVSYVNFTTLKQTFDPTLDLVADILINPSFPSVEFDRLKKEHLDNIQREKAEPFSMAIRVFPKFLFETGHPYSSPLSGSGFESTVKDITLDEIRNFYSTWFKPNNATLIIVGDVELASLVSILETKLKSWAKGNVPQFKIASVKSTAGKKIYLMNRPESTQSVIISGYVISPYGQVSQPALTALNNILGGDFVSRLNMNIREDKHWSYGAGSVVLDTKGQRPFIAYTSVQMDKTKETIQEIQKELTGIISDKPVSIEEFNRVQNNMVLQLPGLWETNSSVAGSLVEKVTYNLSDDYFKTYDAKVRNLSKDELQLLSNQIVKPDQVNWFVVGDKSKIIENLKETGYEIIEVDADGNPVQK